MVAYIPRDLYRSARNINFGITKPLLTGYADGDWDMRPAPDLFEFYRGYQDARSQFRLGPWWLGFLAENREYYLPFLNRAAYEARFMGVREHLRDLAAAHDVRIMLVRLANGDLSRNVAMLDGWATQAFSAGERANPRFVDIEPCVQELAHKQGLDPNQEFRGHPGARAHGLFARCLLPIAMEELRAQP
jgi:hypothetical protein